MKFRYVSMVEIRRNGERLSRIRFGDHEGGASRNVVFVTKYIVF